MNHVEPKHWTEFASLIRGIWFKCVDRILETASCCAEASSVLSAGDKAELISALPFSEATFSKLVKIGNDERLRTPDVRQLLPLSYSTIYEVALLSDRQLQQSVEDGVLWPDASRKDISSYRSMKTERTTLPVDDDAGTSPCLSPESAVRFAEIRIPGDLSNDARAKLECELRSVTEQFGSVLLRHLTRAERSEERYKRAMDKFVGSWLRHARQLTKQRVKELRAATKASGRKWGFAPDETHLGSTSGWDEIEQVLSILGIEDELEGIRNKAETLANAPEHSVLNDAMRVVEDVGEDALDLSELPWDLGT